MIWPKKDIERIADIPDFIQTTQGKPNRRRQGPRAKGQGPADPSNGRVHRRNYFNWRAGTGANGGEPGFGEQSSRYP